MKTSLDCDRGSLDLTQVQVMGILNTTPDSFSDGGQFNHLQNAVEQALAMVEQGASIIDIGGESTRPGAAEVSVKDELERVVPVISAIRQYDTSTLISVDTSKPEVMTAAIEAGGDIINDVYALRREGALRAAAATGAPVCLMHMQGQPRTMQSAPHYTDLIGDISDFFEKRIIACLEAGIPKEKLVLDPGFGFGKTLAHNYQLMAELQKLSKFGLPLLVGASRKSMIGNLLDRPVSQRLAGSLAAALFALERGASILRVHDVQATVDAVKVWQACRHPESLQD
ncbi:dihydropteroate synthase [Paraferrimonas sedimenticola]|nr:dihydropteroate synthase [Paraferrimonas sedimenticola]